MRPKAFSVRLKLGRTGQSPFERNTSLGSPLSDIQERTAGHFTLTHALQITQGRLNVEPMFYITTRGDSHYAWKQHNLEHWETL